MIEIIPAMDIMDAQCVRLKKGDFGTRTTYSQSPQKLAQDFESIGIRRLHMVDLDGAKSGQPKNVPTLQQTAHGSRLVFDFGGGIRQDKHISAIFSAGARYVTIGSMAVKHEALFNQWLDAFGPERFIVSPDVRGREIAVSGWQEGSGVDVFGFVEQQLKKGIRQVLCTDIARDGMLSGVNIALYQELKAAFPEAYLIASGGVQSVQDIDRLNQAGIDAVIIGKAFYEGHITLDELSQWI